MSFNDRVQQGMMAEKDILYKFDKMGAKIHKLGYEKTIPQHLLDVIKQIQSPTAHILRYLPDYFIIYNHHCYFLEIKSMDVPIVNNDRIEFLKKQSKDDTLNKNNVGVIETTAFNIYKKLMEMGVEIILVVYCSYHQPNIIAGWLKNINTLYYNNVKYGVNNASKAPYTNINLDQLQPIDVFIDGLKTELDGWM